MDEVTEIRGDPKIIFTRWQRIIRYLGWGKGNRHRFIRYYYWKLSGHKYLWGIRHFLYDNFG